jgi:hypothetical protein
VPDWWRAWHGAVAAGRKDACSLKGGGLLPIIRQHPFPIAPSKPEELWDRNDTESDLRAIGAVEIIAGWSDCVDVLLDGSKVGELTAKDCRQKRHLSYSFVSTHPAAPSNGTTSYRRGIAKKRVRDLFWNEQN